MSDRDISVEIIGSLSAINAQDWDACSDPNAASDRPLDPFTTYRFLRALEDSGSVGEGTGWQPLYMIAREQDQIIGTAPMYLKSHSQGEYIFDHNWAHAYERAGGRYYPKLQIAAPFTPATGRRFLTKSEHHETAYRALIEGACRVCAKEPNFIPARDILYAGRISIGRQASAFYCAKHSSFIGIIRNSRPLMISWAHLRRANAKTFAKNAPRPKPLADEFCN